MEDKFEALPEPKGRRRNRDKTVHQHKRLMEYTTEERAEIMMHLGQMLLALPTTSEFARHNYPRNTFLDYVDPPQTPMRRVAWNYLRDFLKRPHGMTTEAMIEKWGRLK